MKEASPIACTLSAMNTEQRERYRLIREELLERLQEVRELPGGYAFRYLCEPSAIVMAAFITLERLCCPFLSFSLELEENSDVFWLRLTGGEGVKAFLRSEIGLG